ncbi:MAG: hypothetical protein AAGL17_13785, partial [Cyanobacteria bacterium J06576_12]
MDIVGGAIKLASKLSDIERRLYGSPDSPRADAPCFTKDDFVDYALGQGKRSMSDIRDVLNELEKAGWTNERVRVNGVRRRLYRPSWYDGNLLNDVGNISHLSGE